VQDSWRSGVAEVVNKTGRRFRVVMDDATFAALQAHAGRHVRTVDTQICIIVRQYLARYAEGRGR
jgi:hypothetical protein